MRLSAFLVFAVFACPAGAAESIADQAQSAFSTFAAGKSQIDFAMAGYGATAFNAIAGKWVSLGGPAADSGIESYGADAEKACKSSAVLTLASPNALTLTLAATPAKSQFQQIYTLVAGSTFSEYTNPAEYLIAIGLGPEKTGPDAEQGRALALSLANGIVQIYRPSDDVLVITRDKSYPTVLVRCPA